MLRNKLSITILIVFGFSLFPVSVFAAGNCTGYTWGENVGWINFNPTQGEGVTVTDSAVTGYAWSENVGWISLNCSNDDSCATVDYKVSNDGSGSLSGYAWGENIGWINFNPTGGGVTIDSGGSFSGYAWGENIGWINFGCNECSVSTTWRSTPGTTPLGGSPPPPTPEEEVTPSEEEAITPTPVTLAEGMLIKQADDPRIYVIRDGQKLWIPTAEAFEEAGYDWSEVKTVSASDVAATKSVVLFKLADDPKVYVIKDEKRMHVPSPRALENWGYSWDDVVVVAANDIASYLDITLVRLTDDPKVYVLGKGLVRHIPSPEVFNSYGFSWGDIFIITKTELESFGVSDLFRAIGQTKVWKIEDGERRWVASAKIFEGRGFRWEAVFEVNQAELEYYEMGQDITD